MPPLRYWISGPALYLTVELILAVILGVLGLGAGADRIVIVALALAGTGVAGLGWYKAASESQAASFRDGELTKLREALDQLAATPAKELGAHLQNLSGLPSDELRRRVAAITLKMRALEAIYRDQTSRLFGVPPRDATEQDRQAAWDESNRESSRASERRRANFQRDILPEALALRNEIAKRVGFKPSLDEKAVVALDLGALAGPDPLGEAALHLEELVRQLP